MGTNHSSPAQAVAAVVNPKPADPRDQVREWNRELRKVDRGMDRQITMIEREEAKTKALMRDAAKKDDMYSARLFARELVNSKKAKTRLYTAKAQLNSISMTLSHQAAQMRVAGAMQKSGEIMQAMNGLMRISEVRDTMQTLSAEMTRAGLIDEMIGSALDDADPADEEAADGEVESIISEILAPAKAGSAKLPEAQAAEVAEPTGTAVERLAALTAGGGASS
eukprot:TRINITY_DN35202_c0_g1_i1.p1 TRINITY_DN35202_c0_g1~~TRINITY_DN35202_c0_g1_i1.p1  ORF type:complete len:223 (+),score=54.52 TRINITY_DN35202_c0_g1_i1:63-731(+)